MRILIISDIHSNLAALDSALTHARSNSGFDRVWSLGDSIGYGPQPNECLARLRELGALAVAGNHEKAALGEVDLSTFNPYAAEAMAWTMSVLSPDMTAYVRGLPVRAEEADVTIVHGSPRDPVWEYVLSVGQAVENVAAFSTRGCAHGHTHVPVWLMVEDGKVSGGRQRDGVDVSALLRPGAKFFLNPGSVGQPRDGDPRASYALLDSDRGRVSFHRVGYDIAATQRLMEAVGLPYPLIARLALGM